MWDAIIILFFHWIADFLLQTTEMATNKSKSNYWLTKHVMAYYWGILPVSILVIHHTNNAMSGVYWLFLNAALHWITDYFTSRWTSKLYAAKKFYGFPSFFSVIGFDQFIHAVCLFTTFKYIAL